MGHLSVQSKQRVDKSDISVSLVEQRCLEVMLFVHGLQIWESIVPLLEDIAVLLVDDEIEVEGLGVEVPLSSVDCNGSLSFIEGDSFKFMVASDALDNDFLFVFVSFLDFADDLESDGESGRKIPSALTTFYNMTTIKQNIGHLVCYGSEQKATRLYYYQIEQTIIKIQTYLDNQLTNDKMKLRIKLDSILLPSILK